MGDVNKLLLHINDKPMIQETLNQIVKSDFDEVLLILGFEADKVREAVKQDNVRIFVNDKFESGMTSSIQCGIKNLKDGTDGYMVCLGDMPFIKTDDYNKLIHEFKSLSQSKKIVVPIYEDLQGNPRVFSMDFIDEVLVSEEPRGCKKMVKRNKEYQVHIPMESDRIFRDIDFPEEYEKLKV